MSKDKTTSILRILLVEHNEHDRSAFHRAFRKSPISCEITECVRAKEALEQLRSGTQAYDIVVAGYKLPGMSGLDLFRRMREEDIRTPFVMLTGTGSEQFTVEALQSGVDDYIIKDTAQAYLRLLPVMLPEVLRRHNDHLEHKKVEEALHLSEEKLRTLFDTMNEFIIVTDLQGNITDINRTALEAHGFADREEMVGQNCSSFIVSSDRHSVVGLWAGALRGGSSQMAEVAFLDKRGNEIPVELCAAVLRRKSGNPVGLVGVGRDITERKKADEVLRESEERYRTLAEAMNDGVFTLDLEGKFSYCNRRFEEVTGYSPGDLVGQHFSKVLAPEYVESTIDTFRRGISGEETPLYEIEILGKDGKRTPIELNVKTILDKEGRVTGRLGVARDITERKKAEEELELRSKLLDNIQDAINLTDFNGNFVYVNEMACKSLGYSKEELLKIRLDELDTMGYAHALKWRNQELMKKKHTIFESANFRKDGAVIPVEVQAQLIEVGDKKLVLSVDRDITERKRAERAMADEATRRRILIDQSRDGIVVLDQNGKIYESNKRFTEMLGYSSEETQQLYVWDWEYQFPREQLLDMLRDVDATGDHFETQHRRKDGTIYDVEISTNGALFAGQKLIFCVCRDITEHKQAEGRIEHLNAVLRAIRNVNQLVTREKDRGRLLQGVCDNLIMTGGYHNDWIALLDESGKLLNRAEAGLGDDFLPMVELMKRGKLTSCGRRALKQTGVVVTEDPMSSCMDCPLSSKYAGRRAMTVKLEHEGKVYGLLSASVSSRMATDVEELGLFYEVATDISFALYNMELAEERKRMEAARKDMEQKAQASSRLATIGELASGMAHEINNPLVSVVGFSQLMMERGDLPEEVRERLGLINTGGMRIASIIQRLLSFARQQKLERAYTSINDSIEEVIGLRAYEMKAGNIEVSTQLDPDLPWTVADAGQLQQVFLNIVINAEKEMKAAHGGGKLSIKTKAIDKTIRISFKDDGPGIDKENLDRIFDPFFTTREVGEGTGLGLSICYGIIAEHNGRIYAKSKPGKGATFIVELPVITADREQKPAQPVTKESVKAAMAKILVVDDEVTNLQLISSVLTGEGHEIETVDNAGDALEMIKKGGYDLFLLDIKIPGMSGKELYSVIQDIAPALADRVVFVTGDILGKDTRDFLSKTGAPYINKPFDNEELKRIVNRVLAKGL